MLPNAPVDMLSITSHDNTANAPSLGMLTRWRIPVPIAAPIADFWLGSPFAVVRNFLHLDSEHSMPAWYSSMQWFCAGIHEWLGQKSDVLLPGGSRKQTVLSRTGTWPFLIGAPVLAALAVIVLRMRYRFLPVSPRALRLLATGLVIMFTGALAIELGANLIEKIPENRGLYLAQLVAEEFMEMLGVSFIVWSAYELLQALGVALQMSVPTRPLPSSATELARRVLASGQARVMELNSGAAASASACTRARRHS